MGSEFGVVVGRRGGLTWFLSVLIVVSQLMNQQAYAAKPPPGIKVAPSELFTHTVAIRINKKKKKKKSYTIACLASAPGKTIQSKGQTYFQSFTAESKQLKKKIKRAKSSAVRSKLQARLKLVKALSAAGRPGCVEPEFASLRPYTGPFGERQVRRLLEVFALGGNEALVSAYTQMGLAATVQDLITAKADPYAVELMDKLSCDTNPDDAERNCYRPTMGGINDYYVDGLVAALNIRLVVSKNPVHMALMQWVMDQRAPVNPRALGNTDRWMFRNHVERVLEPFAASGNYKQYVNNYINDPLGHGKWLSGVSNHVINAQGVQLGIGNEDFARELLELLLMGPNDPDGNPNYTDLDVYVGSKILSGLVATNVTDPNNNQIGIVAYSPNLHAPGTHTMFAGTPYQLSVVDNSIRNGEELARQLFVIKRRQISYELARRLWGRFISSRVDKAAFNRLAALIEENDFNLWPVMATMMRSRAFYASESAETIMKDPNTLLVSYARMTGIPIKSYNSAREWFSNLGMLLGRPPTVFGFSYQNRLLASDLYQLERFRALFNLTFNQNFETIRTEFGWTPHNGLIVNIPRVGLPEEGVVDAMIRRLNLEGSVTPAQRGEYIKFVAHYLDNCPSNSDPNCFVVDGARRKLYRDVPDLGNEASDFYRTRLLLVMLGTSAAFQTM